MQGDMASAENNAALPVDTLVNSGADKADVNAIAARSDRSTSVMIWNYADEETRGPAAHVSLKISDLPANTNRVLLSHYRIDRDHSNAYTVWKRMGSPQNPTPEQYEQLEAAGQLQLLGSPEWINERQGSAIVDFDLPSEAISLVRLSW
jgi:xylan 1,4-beta-xylosidase